MTDTIEADSAPLPGPTSQMILGVLDHGDYQKRILPLLERCKLAATRMQAVQDLRTIAQSIGEKPRREEALTHLDRFDASLQNNRWNRNAAGQVLEAMCVHRLCRLPDQIAQFKSIMDYLYRWNPDHAETLYVFLAYLSDHTLAMATSVEAWRVVLTPEQIEGPAESCRALSPHEFRRILEQADHGGVFSPEEATEFSEWWKEIRGVMQAASREANGVYLCIR